jgi:hypothetical protein
MAEQLPNEPNEMTELGTTGLRRSGGFIIDEYINALRGARGHRTYREMSENDPVIGSILFAIEKILLRLEWRIDAGDDSEQDEEVRLFVEECLNDMSDSWDQTLQSILSMLVHGWSYHEVVYKRRLGPNQDDPSKRSKYTDNKIGWRKWSIRAQETLWRWDIDENGGVQGLYQIDPSSYRGEVHIPIEKSLLFRTSVSKNNPEGRSLLRNAYRPWYFKKRIEEIEAVGIERDLAGLPVAYVPPEYLASNASASQAAVLSAITNIVQGIKRNEQEGVVFPLMYDDAGHEMFRLQLLSTGGQRQFDTDKIISRYDQRIAMSVLSDFILLGHDRVGSFSLGTSKIDLWTMAVEAIAKSIAEVVNTHGITRLLALNGIKTDKAPYLTYGDVAQVELTELGDFIQKLTAAGALTPDEKLEEYLRDIAGLPPMEAPEAGMLEPQRQPMLPNQLLQQQQPETQPQTGAPVITTEE